MQSSSNQIVIFILVATTIILLLAAFIITLLYFYRKAHQNFLQKETTLKSEYEKTLLATQVELQEDTFRHVSREIHDNISLNLTLAKLHLNSLDWNNRSHSQDKVEQAIDTLGRSIEDLNDLSKSLNADFIARNGLLPTLEKEISKVRQLGLFRVNLEIKGEPVYLEPQKELMVLRIIQEALNNIIKHASAENVHISLSYRDNQLAAEVRDDGRGFRVDEETTASRDRFHAGIGNMKMRAAFFNGHTEVESQPGKGTLVRARLPY